MREEKGTMLRGVKKIYEKLGLCFWRVSACIDYYVERHELERANKDALIKPSIESGKYIIRLIQEEEKRKSIQEKVR